MPTPAAPAKAPLKRPKAALKQVQEYLKYDELQSLRQQYQKTSSEIEAIFRNLLPQIYLRSAGFVDEINDLFYGHPPPDTATTRTALSAADRERCIIALLASRGDARNLSLHIYLALMEGVSPQEVANIMLLAGIYSGVSNFTAGLRTIATTLQLLQQQVRPLSGNKKNFKLSPPQLNSGAIFTVLNDHPW